jgi:hypothetical protein
METKNMSAHTMVHPRNGYYDDVEESPKVREDSNRKTEPGVKGMVSRLPAFLKRSD